MVEATQDASRTPRGAAEAAGGRQPPRLSVRDGYSLFVGTLKVVLPALAAAMILLVAAWPQLVTDESRFRVGLSELAPEAARNLTMVNPRFQGRDTEDRPFSVVAETAMQESSGADRVELEQPQADITLADGAWVALTAAHGTYARGAQHLWLDGEVSLFHDHGFEMRTQAAQVDLKAGTAESDTDVAGHGPSGTLVAEGFRVRDKGRTIVFTGRSKLTVYGHSLEGTL